MTVIPMTRPEPDPDSFDAFWAKYPRPRREGKVIAKAKWEAITGPGLRTRTLDRDSGQYVHVELKATPEEILAGLEKYVAQFRMPDGWQWKDDGKYICQPATFLNRGRWQDFE